MNSALPDSTGRLWFVAKTDGVVGTIARRTGRIHVMRLGNGSAGEIENSFAVGAHRDVYIATNRRLYRFTAAAVDGPRSSGRSDTAAPADQARPGRRRHRHNACVAAGRLRRHHRQRRPDGCRGLSHAHAPTRRAAGVRDSGVRQGRERHRELAHRRRTVAGRREQLRLQRSEATSGGRTTTPGLARVDINANGRGCHLVWTNRAFARRRSSRSSRSRPGLIYTYTKGTDPPTGGRGRR